MSRRLFVSVLVAALTLVVAPRPASARADDHRRCMYRCKERGYRAPARRTRPVTPVRPLRHDCYHCGGGSGIPGPPNWGGRWQYFAGPVWIWTPRRPIFHDSNGGWGQRRDRWDPWDRWHDPSRDSGYNAHRHHPRNRDF